MTEKKRWKGGKDDFSKDAIDNYAFVTSCTKGEASGSTLMSWIRPPLPNLQIIRDPDIRPFYIRYSAGFKFRI